MNEKKYITYLEQYHQWLIGHFEVALHIVRSVYGAQRRLQRFFYFLEFPLHCFFVKLIEKGHMPYIFLQRYNIFWNMVQGQRENKEKYDQTKGKAKLALPAFPTAGIDNQGVTKIIPTQFRHKSNREASS